MFEGYGLITGWGLGILSTPVVGFINDYKERESVRKGLVAELSDIRVRMLVLSFRLAINTQNLNVEFVEWLKFNVRSISGSEDEGLLGIRTLFQPLLSNQVTTQQLIITIGQTVQGTLSLSPFEVPFMESKISSLHLLTQGQQEKIFAFKRQLSFVNQKILKVDEWNKMTFEITDPGNHALCVQNERSGMNAIFTHSKAVVREINGYFKEPGVY